MIALLLLILSAASIARTKFETDVFQLFPAKQDPLKLFIDTLRWTGGANEAYFLIEGEPDLLPAEAESFAEKLRKISIDGKPAFRRVNYRLVNEADAAPFAQFIGDAVLHPQLFLPQEKISEYLKLLAPSGQAEALSRTTTLLASQAGMGMEALLLADPLGMCELIMTRLKHGIQSLDLDPASPYFLSRDHRVLVMIGEPASPVQNMPFARKLAAGIETARKGAKAKISVAGAHVSAAMDEAAMKKEIIACVLSSLLVVLALFYLTYRRVLPTLLLPVIIAWGVALALGLVGAFLSSVHIISFAFTALIIGLGTDYSIHLYDRFHMERSKGVPIDEALRLAGEDTGHGIFSAATTTALPFLCLGVADMRALSELGLLVGLGVIFTMYATFLFLPPLLILMEKMQPSSSYSTLPGFGLSSLWKIITIHPKTVKIILSLIIVTSVISATRVKFDGELKNLQPKHSEAFLTLDKIDKHLSISPKQMLIAVDDTTLPGALSKGSRVDRLAADYVTKGAVVDYSGLGTLFNDDKTQEIISGKLREGLAGTDTLADASSALATAGFDRSHFELFLGGISGLGNLKPIPQSYGVNLLSASPLNAAVSRHLVKDSEGYHRMTYLYYRGSEFPEKQFLSDLSKLEPTARSTGVDMVSRQLADLVKRNFLLGALLGGSLVLFVLFSHFKDSKGMFAALFPVFAGIAAMLGIMASIGMGINFMNAMVLVTILGMGSDYGLHLAHRVKEGDADKADSYVQTGRAIILSALTTIAGFGSLAFADYGALASIGWATNFGVGATLFFTLFALPPFLQRKTGPT